MKRLFLLLTACLPYIGMAQQEAIYSQYMFNHFAINPAYAGSRDALSAVLLHRAQWVGLDGAPQTTSLAVHSKLKGKRVALGFNSFVDRLGPTTNAGAFVTYAYHLPLAKGNLSFGARGGIYNSLLDRNKLDFFQGGDIHDQGGAVNALVPSFDAGVYYYTYRFYMGLSSMHLGGSKRTYSNDSQIQMEMNQHFMAAAGLAIPMGRDLVFRPSLLARYVNGAPFNMDVNASFLFRKTFWLGVSYRTSGSITMISEFNVTQFMRIGYSYDLILSRLRLYNSGSHELFIGFDVNLKKDKVISPRYL